MKIMFLDNFINIFKTKNKIIDNNKILTEAEKQEQKPIVNGKLISKNNNMGE